MGFFKIKSSIKLIQDHANDIISKIENKTAMLINKLMDEETESKTRIRNAEKDLLAKIKQNPHKWSSTSMKFKMTVGTSSTPRIGVEILKNSQYSEISGESETRPGILSVTSVSSNQLSQSAQNAQLQQKIEVLQTQMRNRGTLILILNFIKIEIS